MGILVLGILATITSVWALNSNARVDELEQEIAKIRAAANASVFDLVPTNFAPNSAQGQVFVSLSGSGVVTVSGLPQPGDNEVFTLWYLVEDGTASHGGTLNIDDLGQGYILVPGDADSYSQIAISLEATGNTEPAGNYLLVAEVNSGKG